MSLLTVAGCVQLGREANLRKETQNEEACALQRGSKPRPYLWGSEKKSEQTAGRCGKSGSGNARR